MRETQQQATDRLALQIAEGLALLPANLRRRLESAPEGFRHMLGNALFGLNHCQAESDYDQGVHFGKTVGSVTTAYSLNVIDGRLFEDLMRALPQVKAR
ncbi:hypothetical protein [Pseudomonas putida]|uniref:hypothetical protein n=1 Tax=Pseudomonas putida TaxID=303 RepID=UPI00235B976F|nr:hypothetical protein [Pseudomonas putida]GLO25406.1 hypothetical protein PPUJ21368_32350 [Pseudomonas putida]HDS0968638.1 hypothetical protein [Pseudomonas putida]